MAYTKDEIQTFKNEIIDHISNGKSLKSTLDNHNHLPNRQTVYNWLNKEHDKFDKEFLDNYARATKDRADLLFDEMLEIADTTEEGITTKESDKGTETTTGDMIQHRRLRVDTRKWALSRMNPKKYGDKLETVNEHKGDITITRKVVK